MKAKRNVVRLKNCAEPALSTIFCISAHENDYRLTWSINQELGLAFKQCANSLVVSDGNEFTCFLHKDEFQKIMLVSNRCDNGFLIKKYKNFDFFLKFDSNLSEEQTAYWYNKLKHAPLVSAFFLVPDNQKKIFFFDFFE